MNQNTTADWRQLFRRLWELGEVSRDKRQWGRWTFDDKALVLRHDSCGYQVDLERMTSGSWIARCLFHMHEKVWLSHEDIGYLVEAIHDLINPEGLLEPIDVRAELVRAGWIKES